VAEKEDMYILLECLDKQTLITRSGLAHARVSSVTAVIGVCTARGEGGHDRLMSIR
jgi:hypothetical protein